MKRFLTVTALAGTLALGACSGMSLPECSSSDLDGCGRDMAYTEERTAPVGNRAPAPAPEPVVVAPEPQPEPEPMPEPEPVAEPAPEPVDTQIMRQADEPVYVKGMSK